MPGRTLKSGTTCILCHSTSCQQESAGKKQSKKITTIEMLVKKQPILSEKPENELLTVTVSAGNISENPGLGYPQDEKSVTSVCMKKIAARGSC